MSALQHKVNSIVRRARRLQWQFAAARFLTMTLAALLVLGAIDFLIRFQDRGLRVMATAGALAAVGWAAWRYLRPAWHWRCSPVRVALRIEQRLPQLRGLLANSIEYLGHSAQQRDLGGWNLVWRTICTSVEPKRPTDNRNQEQCNADQE